MRVRKICRTCKYNEFNVIDKKWECTSRLSEHCWKFTRAEQTCEYWTVDEEWAKLQEKHTLR